MTTPDFATLIIGTWSLIDYRRTKGEVVVLPFGADPLGFLQYGAEGRMSATLAHRSRPSLSTPPGADWRGDPAEWAEAAMSYVAYTGRYQVEGDRVSHFVDASLYPNWTGTTLLRWASLVEREGETLLLLVTAPPGPPDKDALVSHLLWRRWMPA
jgi:hypothetical protein